MTAAEIINEIRADYEHLTYAKIGHEIDRSERWVREYAKGKEPPPHIITRLNKLYEQLKEGDRRKNRALYLVQKKEPHEMRSERKIG